METPKKKAIIIGAGPAGLTAAYELLAKTDILPIIIESSSDIGGISKTVNYKGNRIDIGGHRFFSKSEIIMQWWQTIFPREDDRMPEKNPDKTDNVFLVRNRQSRILFLGKLFDYPISLSLDTLKNLGIFRIIKILLSYTHSRFYQRHPEKSLEDFFINRFGKVLYKTFFKSYTEKVWGVSCNEISPLWGGQRIKGLSVTKTIVHAIRRVIIKPEHISQKTIETSLISKFLYPKHGPGQLWEEVAKQIRDKGAKIMLNHEAIRFECNDHQIKSCIVKSHTDGNEQILEADYFISTMPICDLIKGLGEVVPAKVIEIASGLTYRDFITIGVLLEKIKLQDKNTAGLINDNWIYIQEDKVKAGRLQIFNNWSPYLVQDKTKVWIGLEYFCFEGDDLWNKTEEEFKVFAIDELEKLKFADKNDVLDTVIIKVSKAYPCYFGTYDNIDVIINFVNTYNNLYLIGRNGMHKYNNQDHSMLTAIVAVENIVTGTMDKSNIWKINLEADYHEEKISKST